MPVTLEDIRAARERIRGAIYRSPCPISLSLSRLCGADVYCKLDHLQMTGSFKERGARNKLMQLSTGEKQHGVVAASAGNHALGLGYHGQLLGIPVTVVMPKWAPLVKVQNCRLLNVEVILCGETYDEAKSRAKEIAHAKAKVYVPGFDDAAIIAGAGTMGLEILEDVPDVDAVIVPVGGGGLIAGVGGAVRSLNPKVKIIGVEPANAPTLHDSLKAGHVVKIATKPTLADGLAVAEAGELCFEMARKYVDQILLVNEGDIARSVLKLLELEKTVAEGAGAAPLAVAMRAEQFGLRGKKIALCLSGGNIDLTMISRVIDRGLAAEGRLCRITARLSDRPGSLAQLTTILGAAGASVKEVRHDRHFGPADVAMVNVTCVLETRDFDHIAEIGRALRDAGIEHQMAQD
jgi:threonine dehydratase